MGNSKSKEPKYQKVEKMLIDSYNNTGLEFSFKEMMNFKLRIQDAENYFHTKFEYFLFFNNYVFHERLTVLYDNFNSKIEAAKKNVPFTVLIDFDDECESVQQGIKLDFDPLFTIIFERLEISVLVF